MLRRYPFAVKMEKRFLFEFQPFIELIATWYARDLWREN